MNRFFKRFFLFAIIGVALISNFYTADKEFKVITIIWIVMMIVMKRNKWF